MFEDLSDKQVDHPFLAFQLLLTEEWLLASDPIQFPFPPSPLNTYVYSAAKSNALVRRVDHFLRD
jgi:hypothetical protein